MENKKIVRKKFVLIVIALLILLINAGALEPRMAALNAETLASSYIWFK